MSRTTISEAVKRFSEEEARGEYVLVIEGKSLGDLREESREAFQKISMEEHLESYVSEGLSRMEAMKRVAKDRGLSKREVYAALNRDDKA